MRKIRSCFAFFAVPIALTLSCGIPTSMPVLPKEVVVKMEPSVSVPLDKINYNLYSGLSGGAIDGGTGSLDDLFGASWVQDLKEKGITLYDYRPSDAEDDNTQKFLVHYKLNVEDALGTSLEFDLSEYQETLDELTGKPTAINDVSFDIPSIDVKESFDVTIPLGKVSEQIGKNTKKLNTITAYLPVEQREKNYEFPYDIKQLPPNSSIPQNSELSVTLQGMESLTFQDGTINFKFTLNYVNPLNYGNLLSFPPLAPGSKLELSDFELRTAGASREDTETIKNIKVERKAVALAANGATGSLSIGFTNTELPQKFDLVCKLKITGSGPGFFQLDIDPELEDFTISGVSGLVLEPEQQASLGYNFPETISEIGGNLGPSFKATVGEGQLAIDTGGLFPPLDPARPGAEGWNLALDLSGLKIEQANSPAGVKGLSLGGSAQPLRPGNNDLHGKTLNHRPVKISGKVSVSIPNNKLTFRNFPGGIKSDGQGSYAKQIEVKVDVSRFSEVTVKAEDFGLDNVNQEIKQELGDDFTGFKEWLNYIQFSEATGDDPNSGLGVVLEIGKLNMVGGLGLYIDAPDFGLNNVFQPLVNLKDPATGKEGENAKLIFKSRASGGYRLTGEDLPGKGNPLLITVKLGLEDPKAQKNYEDTGLLTMKDVVPGKTIEVRDAAARLVFDWTEISIKPRPHEKEGSDDVLPTYPFVGTFPDKDEGEEGIDLSDMPKGLSFYLPGEDAEEGLSARLYLSLKRKILDDNGDWVDDPGDDPKSPGYDENDPDGWRRNLKIPNLDFRIRYSDNEPGEDLFPHAMDAQGGAETWILSRPMADILQDMENPGDPESPILKDTENEKNPFSIYTAHTLPEADKAISLDGLAEALNDAFSGKKEGPLFFEYRVEFAGVPGKEEGTTEPGEILLYPEMLKKKIVISVDLLLLIPLVFQANPGPDAEEGAPAILIIDPDLGEDLFQRKTPDDNEFFDTVTSFGFDIAVKNVAGISAGKVFLENKTDIKKLKYRIPIVDFTSSRSNLALDSGELEKIKAIWPFIPQVSIEFDSGEIVRIERNFNIALQSITVKAGGEYAFETGL